MAKYEDPNQLDYRNGGDTVDDFAQKYMRTIAYVFKALNDLRTPTGNTAGVEPEPYMWRIADNKLYIRNADNTDYVLLGDISPNFGFRQSMNDRFITTADLEREGTVVVRDENNKVTGDITGSPNKIADKPVDVTPTSTNDILAYDATQQAWVKKTLNDYLKKTDDPDYDDLVAEIVDQVITDITPVIFNYWRPDAGGYLTPLGSNVIAPQYGSNNNSVGAADRPWKEGHFDSVKLNGGDLGTYLAESTGYGIVSGCTPSISGLTVTVGAGVVHLADGTRKEIAETSVTLDNADSTNPRIDLVYIDSTGAVAKITGTASASPVVPSVPTNGISVCNVSVAAGATTGTVTDKRCFAFDPTDTVEYLFPDNVVTTNHGDCQIVKTNDKVLMIDSGAIGQVTANHIIDYCLAHGIDKIDYFLVTHYHQDHYSNIQYFLAQNQVDFNNTIWYIPPHILNSDTTDYNNLKSWLAGKTVYETTADFEFKLSNTVTVSCFNCNAEDRQHYINAGITDLNPFSTCAFVTHKNTSALYMADATGEAQNWLYQQGKYRRSELLKVAHHGIGEAGNYFYLNQISPLYAVCNMCLDESTTLNNADYGAQSENLNLLNAINPSCLHYLQNGSCEFISDGYSISDISDKVTLVQRVTFMPTGVTFHVNESATNTFCDGSLLYPFRTARQAVSLIPDNPNIVPTISVDDIGANKNIDVVNRTNLLIISIGTVSIDSINLQNSIVKIWPKNTNDLLTVGNVYIGNCNKITFTGDVSTKIFQADNSTVIFQKTLTHLPTAAERFTLLDNAEVRIKNLNVDASGYSATKYSRQILVFNSRLMVDACDIKSCGQALNIKQNSMFGCYKISAQDISYLFCVPDMGVGIIQVSTYGTMSNITNYTLGQTKFIDIPANP